RCTLTCWLGAVSVDSVRMLAELSTISSSQNGYTAAFGLFAAGADGIAPWFQDGPLGATKLITPLVSTQPVVYVWPYSRTPNGNEICWYASSPLRGNTVWSAGIQVRAPATQVLPNESAHVVVYVAVYVVAADAAVMS